MHLVTVRRREPIGVLGSDTEGLTEGRLPFAVGRALPVDGGLTLRTL